MNLKTILRGRKKVPESERLQEIVTVSQGIQTNIDIPHTNFPSAYPGLGIAYVFNHRDIRKKILLNYFVCIGLGLLLMTLAYHYAGKNHREEVSEAITKGDIMKIGYAVILAQSAVLSVFMIIFFCIHQFVLDGIFDRVMYERGHDLRHNAELTFKRKMYRRIHPFVVLISAFVLIPIDLVPLFGNFLFIFFNSYVLSWGCHLHYFELKHMTWNEARKYVNQNWREYFMFGFFGGCLEAIPVAGLFFLMTNCVGAALWACEKEENGLGPVVNATIVEKL